MHRGLGCGCRVSFHFKTEVTRIDFDDRAITYTDAEGQLHTKRFGLLVGADGRHSQVRGCMQAHNPGMKVEVDLADSWYISVLGLTPQEGATWKMATLPAQHCSALAAH